MKSVARLWFSDTQFIIRYSSDYARWWNIPKDTPGLFIEDIGGHRYTFVEEIRGSIWSYTIDPSLVPNFFSSDDFIELGWDGQ